MLIIVVKLLLAYLIGSISGSLILGRMRGVDIRTQGSGNAGGTNAFRTQGAGFALGVVAIDIGKGALAAALVYFAPPVLGVSTLALAFAAGIACAVGHIWPVFFGFRGGKGAAVWVGVLAVALPWAIAPLVGLWLLVLVATGWVGLATIVAGAALPPVVWVLSGDMLALWLASAMGALIVYTHRANLARLRHGTEPRFEGARFWRRWGRAGRSR